LLLWLTVARAKQAMTKATQNVELAPPASKLKAVEPLRLQRKDGPSSSGTIRPHGLMRRMVFVFTIVGVLFSSVVCLIVYSYLGPVLEKEAKGRADAMALGLRDTIPSRLTPGQTRELAVLLDKYVSKSRDGVAYIYIENAKGEIVAHWPAELPRYLHRDFPSSAERALFGFDGDYRDQPIYENTKRLENSGGGYVHFAIWRRAIDVETRRQIAVIAAIIGFVLLGMVVIFTGVMRKLSRPFVEIVEQAERISKGDFDVPLGLQRADEIGDLARSLERMRSSLRAVTARLAQSPAVKQSSK